MFDMNLDELDQMSIDDMVDVKAISSKDIAIIGIAGTFPKAENISEFWENLCQGLDCVSEFPSKRAEDMDQYLSQYYPELYKQGYTKGSFLEEIDKFDYKFFKISPAEASLMDPSQRLFLQTAYHAIEDAGYGGEQLKNTSTGVYLGYNADALVAYRDLVADTTPDLLPIAVPGNLTSVIAGRISYLLDLRGPSISVDTACSSSLVAIHLACQALRSGDCNMALAGSIRLNIMPVNRSQKLGIESSDGITRTFDEHSDGTGNGEGMAVIMLKPLTDALADKDHIYAVIKGSAVNQDGQSIGMTAPNVKAQEEVIEKAWKNAAIAPETISYIEAHGTGTKLGDPIEIDAINRAFKKYTQEKQFCGIGSVKTNMGHLDNAAGMAGVLKSALSLKHKMIPPHIHFETPNEKIDFENSPVYVNTELRPWETTYEPRRCGVSAFGLSGTNCHMILEESERDQMLEEKHLDEVIVTLSAKSIQSLEDLIKRYQEFKYEQGCTLEQIAYTSNIGRGHYDYRLALVVESMEDLQDKMSKVRIPYETMEIEGVFFGKVEGEQQEQDEDFVMEMGQMHLVAKAYVQGEVVKLKKLYKHNPGRTRIPGYAFEKSRCWIEMPNGVKTNKEKININPQLLQKQKIVKPLGKEEGAYTALEIDLVQIFGEVLGFDEVNIYDDFYDLGGDSILGMKIIHLIQERLSIESDITELLECIGVEEYAQSLAHKIPQKQELTCRQKVVSDRNKINTKRYEPASAAQKRLFIIGQNTELSQAYNITNIISIEGSVDANKLEQAFRKIVDRHEALRTSFEQRDGEIMQVIHTAVEVNMSYYEVEEKDIQSALDQFGQGFDLEVAPLIRIGLIQYEKEKSLFVFDCSHIIADGYSINLINTDFMKLYCGGEVEPITYQYSDYTKEQLEMQTREDYGVQKQYWMNKLSGTLPVLALPTDYPRPQRADIKGKNHLFSLPSELLNRVNEFSTTNNVTLFMTLLAAYNILLNKYSGQEEFVVGTPIAGRGHAKYSKTVGLFINTLALRNAPETHKTFAEFLSEVKQTTLEAYKHQAFQFDDLVMSLDIPRDPSRNIIFDTMFILQNLENKGVDLGGIVFEKYTAERETSRYDLMFTVMPGDKDATVEIEYATSLFSETTIERMGEHYLQILSQIVEKPNDKIEDYTIVTAFERHQILEQFNDTQTLYSHTKTLHQLFEEQVRRTPHKRAVGCEETFLTYKELNQRANSLAHKLRGRGVTNESIVGLKAERSLEMMIGILGILKAGGAYMPIGVSYPQDRIAYMLEETEARLILAQEQFVETIEHPNVINLNDEMLYQGNQENPEAVNMPNSLAYVMYTSGSTGRPKGVMIEHTSVINQMEWRQQAYPLSSEDCIMQKTPFTFDISVSELFWWMLGGASLYFLKPGGEKDPQVILETIERQNITIIHFVPSMMSVFLDYYEIYKEKYDLSSLKRLMSGGEALTVAQTEKFNRLLHQGYGVTMHNLYGPTEATIEVSYYDCPTSEKVPPVLIGKPCHNSRLYVLDHQKQLVPVGVIGELYIAGTGVARGYLKREDLTAEKFMEDPYYEGDRMYRSGDLARWLANGQVEYLGRIDNQVKIRGFRIELGEIEDRMAEHLGIYESAVIAMEDEKGATYLCGYYTGDVEISREELKEHLLQKLPDYMIPEYFMRVERMPVSANGKLDRKALPRPERTTCVVTEYVAPQDQVQETLVDIWSEVLNVEKVGINDSFFELGGHSLKAIRLIAEIHKTFKVDIKINEIFEQVTVKEQAEYIEKKTKVQGVIIPKVAEGAYYKLSSAQERLYILNGIEQGTAYNVYHVLKVEGQIDQERFKWAAHTLVDRHEQLRASFHMVDGIPMQKIHKDRSPEWIELSCEVDDVGQFIQEAIRPFDLECEPLMRFVMIHTSDLEHYIVMDTHHIVTDGYSMNLIAEELMRLYQEDLLESLQMTYKDFSEWQRIRLQTGELEKTIQYWVEQFQEDLPILKLPYDYDRPAVQSFEGAALPFTIGEDKIQKLEQIATEHGVTLYMVLLSAYNMMLARYSGQNKIVIGTPTSGRTLEEMNSVVGMFVNTLALPMAYDSQLSYGEFLNNTKNTVIQALEHQEMPFEMLVDLVVKERDPSRNPLFDTMFSYQTNDRQEVVLEDVKISPLYVDMHTTKLDLSLSIVLDQGQGHGVFEYCTKLFNEATIQSIMEAYGHILDEIILQPETIIVGKMRMLSQEETQSYQCENWVEEASYPLNKTLITLFKEQVVKAPEHVGLVSKGIKLSYQEVDRYSDWVARQLVKRGIQKGDIVGIMMDRCPETIIAMIGILKIGGVYLPIDRHYPVERIQYMIEDSQAKCVVTHGRVLEEIAVISCNSLCLDFIWNEPCMEACDTIQEIESRDTAYVIYTSGSTGNPKGVKVSHRNVVNFIYNIAEQYDNHVNEKDRFLGITNICFDVSVCEIFLALCFGSELHFYAETDSLDVENLAQYILDKKITYTYLPPALLQDMCEALKNKKTAVSLNKMLVGVEPIKDFVLAKYLELNSDMKIVNGYGPTEATICATFYLYKPSCNNNRIVPIGTALKNTAVYILDEHLNPVPKGVEGEIYISGEGVAEGYLNQPDLTEAKFMTNPFVKEQIMYRTGDMAKVLKDGNIQYTGRIDAQVKIRGYRIELGEVESRLNELPSIRLAVVLDDEDEQGIKYLCAYIICEENISARELREQLKKKLPEYMIPTYFKKIVTMPLTKNGKVDKQALRQLETEVEAGMTYCGPQNRIQAELQMMWKEILKIEKIGIDDCFFDLGGHSLKATRLASAICHRFEVEMGLDKIFQYSTIRLQAQYIQEADNCHYETIEKAPILPYYPLSPAQQRMYVSYQIESGTAYNIPNVLKLTGEIDGLHFEKTLELLVDRHSQLRASFHMIDGEPVQKIHEKVDVHFIEQVCSEQEIDNYIQQFIKSFDLEQPSLIRFALIHTQKDVHYFIYDMHHIISDGVTVSILAREFVQLYGNQVLDQPIVEYQDYVLWKKTREEYVMKQEGFWLETLSGNLTTLDLPTDYPRPATQVYEGDNYRGELSVELTDKIRRVANEKGMTPYMLCLAAYNIMLYQYTGQEDIIVGTPVAGRNHMALENIVGAFVNTVSLRNYPKGTKSLGDFLEEVKGNTLNAFKHQDYPFEQLVKNLNLSHDFSRNPLFDTMFTYQNINMPTEAIGILEVEAYGFKNRVSKFDITFTLIDLEEKIALDIEYATSLYAPETIERMLRQYIGLIEAIVEDPTQTIDDYNRITTDEEELILHQFNGTEISYSHESTLHQLFEARVLEIPDSPAVGFEDTYLTYRELNQSANSLAHKLRRLGVTNESIVGLKVERSLEMMIGILGILKAGGAYMPIGPNYPQDRIAYMLEETEAQIVLAQEQFIDTIEHPNVINLNDKALYQGDQENLEPINSPNSLAYVMYTSGSTGRPKGVMIEHTSVVNQMEWRQRAYPLGSNDVMMQKTPFTFDISVAELFWWMLGGASLYFLKPGGEKDPQMILETIEAQNITIIHFVPSMMSVFLDYYEVYKDKYDLSSLKRLVSGGEALTVPQTEKFNRLLHKSYGVTMHNLYGPTEATIEVSYYDCPTSEKVPPVLIGKPCSNARLYVLDTQKQLLPVGVIGELYIAGTGVARGYLKREDLTAEKFMADPYYEGQRMYRSGDLARWLPSGDVEYLGRMDNQVKIRGLRIELGEIEERMSEHEAIRESAVTVTEASDDDKYLCGYYTGEEEVSVEVLRRHIMQKLPEYMVPAYFMKLEAMPLSANGKLDRKALPVIKGQKKDNTNNVAYVAPANDR
ncbi:MAG: amino acid adenylation domain-containing protein, partial [Cellulosilyticaceae bacterium]